MKNILNSIENLLADCAVFIRSVGERTEKVCEYALIQNGIAKEDIYYIKNISPFSKALKIGFEEAIRKNKKYSIFVDADRILFPDALFCTLLAIERAPDNIFCITPSSYEYFTGMITPGGPKIYRTNHLVQALAVIPKEKVSLRPETYTIKAMDRFGIEPIFLDSPLAIHDFEQYYKDIFRGVINRQIKSNDPRLEKRIRSLMNKDFDFKIASLAVDYVKNNAIQLALDSEQFVDVFSKFEITEKDEIKDVPDFYQNLIEKILCDKNSYLLRSYTRQLLDYNNIPSSSSKKTPHKYYSKFLRLLKK